MTALPDHLDRSANVDLHGRNVEPWFRGGLFVLLVICALGLANVFGQHTQVLSVDSSAAKLTVETPGAARGGLIYQSIFTIEAHEALRALSISSLAGSTG